MEKVIEVKNLVKKYGDFTAVKGITFDVRKGEIFGLLGENGAGKTTTLEIIESLRKPTSGEIKVLGLDIKEGVQDIKAKIGVQLQSSAYFNFLSLKEILDLFGGFYNSQISSAELLKLVDLEEKANALVGSLSGGQKQRFSIVASLVNNPELVFLDEPTTGLDPLARRRLWELISRIKTQGKAIILTTHYMEEAEILCDRIAIMDQGKILTIGDTHKLIENSKNPYRISFYSNSISPSQLSELNKLGEVENILEKSHSFEIKLKTQLNLNKAIDLIQKTNPESLTVGRATLEDLFIELTGRNIEEENA